MKNKFNALLKNQDGLSLISVIATMAVLGVGLLGVLNLSKMTNKGHETTSRKVDAVSLTSSIEKKLKSVFLDNKNPTTGKLTSGLCSRVSVASLTSQLSNVYIQLPKPSTSDLFTPNLWSAKFSGFNAVTSDPNCQLSSKYGKCFKLNLNADSGLGMSKIMLEKLDPVFEINIKPILTNPATNVVFVEISPEPNGSTKYDLKAIGFEYTIKTTFKSGADDLNLSLGRGFIRGFLWAGDVGICDDPMTTKRISLTANSFGDPNNNTVFNQAGFRSDSVSTNSNPPLELTPINSQIRSGVISGTLGSQFLQSQDQVSNTTPDSGPVYSACNERRFRCVQNISVNRDYQAIRNLMRASYVVPNIINNTGNSIQIAPKVTFENTNGAPLQVNFEEKFILGGRTYSKNNSNWYVSVLDGVSVPLLIGDEQTITANLSDNSDPTSANNICRNICVASSNFNSNPTNHYTSTFNYKVSAGTLAAGVNDTFELATGPVGCTACYMKNCDQFGLGTFGAMHNQPTEPLDSGVPECVKYESHASDFYEVFPNPTGLTPSSCVSAKLKSGDNNGLEYKSDDCATSLPVLCYAYGKHMLARNIVRPTGGSSGSEALANGTFEAAKDVCFRLGKEDIKKAPFKTLLTQDGNLDAKALELLGIANASTTIDAAATMVVTNFITQGSFFAPKGLNQEANLRAYASKSGEMPQMLSQKFWIGLKTDNLRNIYAPAPKMAKDALSPNVKWGIHFDGAGETIVRKVSENPFLNQTTSQKKYGLLFHTPRFKGVTFVQNDKPFGTAANFNLRVLCREKAFPHKIMVSTAKTSQFDQAEGICKAENAIFLPPLTTTGWEIAYQLVNPNNAKHPFPSAWEEAELNPVWVNVMNEYGEDYIDVGNLLSGSRTQYIDDLGQFVDPPGKDAAQPEKICLNQNKGEIVIRNSCPGDERLLTTDEVTLAQQKGNFYMRFMLKMALSKTGGSSATFKIFE